MNNEQPINSEQSIPDYMKYATGTSRVVEESGDLQDLDLEQPAPPVEDSAGSPDLGLQSDGDESGDSLDLSFVPEHLRKADLLETLRNVEQSRKEAEKKMSQEASRRADIERIMQAQGYSDPIDARLGHVNSQLQQTYQQALAQAEQHFMREIEMGRISEADANFQYGQYAQQLQSQVGQLYQQEQIRTNTEIVDGLLKECSDLFEIPSIKGVASKMIGDIINDGDLIDAGRTTEYLKMAKTIYDQAFEAGMQKAMADAKEADKLAELQRQQAQTQERLRRGSVQTRGNATVPSDYASIEDIPQEVWNSNKKIRAMFGVYD